MPTMLNSGYLHSSYVHSLIEFGEPLELPASKGWILKRSISGTSEFDGMGCYPIFTCEKWFGLEKDLASFDNQLVSLAVVTDPFGEYNQQDLIRCFKDIVIPYKEHFIVDLQRQPKEFVAVHHQRNAHKAMKVIDVEICTEPLKYLDQWLALYNTLIERHNITGITRFSVDAFAKQLNVPGIVAFRARSDDKTVGMLLWYVQGNVAYYHLGAYSPDGYKLNASFALFWTLLGYFAGRGLRWLSLGAGAGIHGDANDGLTRFKQGWSTDTRTAYFCGRVFDRKKYQKIVETRGIPPTPFFPAYRLGEF
jgi:hypothetical protein